MTRDPTQGDSGRPPRWITSRKTGVGTAMAATSPLWFTLGDGTINEIYFPRIDSANTRCLELFVADEHGEVVGERFGTDHEVRAPAPGVPGYVLTNTCRNRRFRLTKTVIADSRRPTLLMRVKFEVLTDRAMQPRLFAVLEPHILNEGAENRGWLGDFRGVPLLFAARAQNTLALGCSTGWCARGCELMPEAGGVDVVRRLAADPDASAKPTFGNIALVAEIPCPGRECEFLLAVGFGEHADAAGHSVRASLLSDFAETEREFRQRWNEFHRNCAPFDGPVREGWNLYRTSLAVLRTHESKRFHGGIIASLSTPWGGSHGDGDVGGYHVAWPRDLAHAGVAYLAAGRPDAAQQAMFYLMCTQNPGGDWTQNMWIDGTPNWTAKQLDQTATFVLLADLLRRHEQQGIVDPWPAIRAAAHDIVRTGPLTEQDRWEENAGYTPYTIATAIAALVAAAEFARIHGDDAGERWLQTADAWNNSIEDWLYVTDTPLARKIGVDGYYVRTAPPETRSAADLHHLIVPLKNYPPGHGGFQAWQITTPDVLALVRYGIRRADDPRIVNTVRVVDATLEDQTRCGPCWRRFNHDGYGETADGGPFLGAGIGRCWPVLTGERAHYELAAGNRAAAEALLDAMARQASHGLLPEQIWNAADLPNRGLINGGPTGSATPLVWAHAEFITLLRSLQDNAVFDCPSQVRRRYADTPPKPERTR